MFSMTTIELSTSMPIPMARPAMEITFMVTPEKYMSTSAKSTDTGMEMPTAKVGRMSLRNRNRMRMASAPPKSRLWTTADMAIWM